MHTMCTNSAAQLAASVAYRMAQKAANWEPSSRPVSLPASASSALPAKRPRVPASVLSRPAANKARGNLARLSQQCVRRKRRRDLPDVSLTNFICPQLGGLSNGH